MGSGTHRGWSQPVLKAPTLTHTFSFTMKEWHSETSSALLGVTQPMGIGDQQRTGLSASTVQVGMGEFPDPNPTHTDSTVWGRNLEHCVFKLSRSGAGALLRE